MAAIEEIIDLSTCEPLSEDRRRIHEGSILIAFPLHSACSRPSEEQRRIHPQIAVLANRLRTTTSDRLRQLNQARNQCIERGRPYLLYRCDGLDPYQASGSLAAVLARAPFLVNSALLSAGMICRDGQAPTLTCYVGESEQKCQEIIDSARSVDTLPSVSDKPDLYSEEEFAALARLTRIVDELLQNERTREATLSLLGQKIQQLRTTAQPMATDLEKLATINQRITEVLRPDVQTFQVFLNSLAGKEFGSFEANQEMARAIQDTCDRLGVRVCCPREGCGEASVIRATKAGTARHGVFQFYHPDESGRTVYHGGSTTLPHLQLTEPTVQLVRRRNEETFVEKINKKTTERA